MKQEPRQTRRSRVGIPVLQVGEDVKGLREQKKQATRRHIADVATALFVAKGFDNVTVAEIAEAAHVSKMTVFNYFPRKEDLFLDRHADRVAGLERVIRERPAGVSVATALRRHHHDLLQARHPLSGATEGVRWFWQILRSTPALVSRMHEQGREIEDAFAAVLADEFGDPRRARLVASLLAAAVGAIFGTAVQRLLDGDDVEEVRRDQARIIDEAFDLLEHGIGDYGRR
ncbi:TetR/AcrR family transcriptional regulator [Pseudonocardia asaccharolytica]|uniref:TetR family transcriptional regulator n=1 Tax=Pseudonocardia asaccharolytica DSM 44247 = NBRC 16224 TaxID=1123024 RepID=A0A511D6D6_9PSEU|nr:TetR family transcriptional regulator [Pseudonocardia asaccharolytica]GEL20342.1 TetR family transcriptional regulator [Pseudonocardia asaccharolytica DSM 44247 = NBRC 16224]